MHRLVSQQKNVVSICKAKSGSYYALLDSIETCSADI